MSVKSNFILPTKKYLTKAMKYTVTSDIYIDYLWKCYSTTNLFYEYIYLKFILQVARIQVGILQIIDHFYGIK